mmetsp:Transcript_83663/g.270477  ORF Transcript_83663/g.270477 Transcript_83663/m.270477 type:complete len:398 (-) Transcript_83663:184-1377(-)
MWVASNSHRGSIREPECWADFRRGSRHCSPHLPRVVLQAVRDGHDDIRVATARHLAEAGNGEPTDLPILVGRRLRRLLHRLPGLLRRRRRLVVRIFLLLVFHEVRRQRVSKEGHEGAQRRSAPLRACLRRGQCQQLGGGAALLRDLIFDVAQNLQSQRRVPLLVAEPFQGVHDGKTNFSLLVAQPTKELRHHQRVGSVRQPAQRFHSHNPDNRVGVFQLLTKRLDGQLAPLLAQLAHGLGRVAPDLPPPTLHVRSRSLADDFVAALGQENQRLACGIPNAGFGVHEPRAEQCQSPLLVLRGKSGQGVNRRLPVLDVWVAQALKALSKLVDSAAVILPPNPCQCPNAHEAHRGVLVQKGPSQGIVGLLDFHGDSAPGGVTSELHVILQCDAADDKFLA